MIKNKLEYIVVHHTAVSYKDSPDQFLSVNQYHKDKWNMKSSLGFYGGYNYIISADGKIRQYRAEGEETIAAVGRNFDSLHIALCGNFDLELPTPAQSVTLEKWLIEKVRQYGIPKTKIKPHRAFLEHNEKTCYGLLLKDDWAANLISPPLKMDEKKIVELQAKISILQKMVEILAKLLNLQNRKVSSMNKQSRYGAFSSSVDPEKFSRMWAGLLQLAPLLIIGAKFYRSDINITESELNGALNAIKDAVLAGWTLIAAGQAAWGAVRKIVARFQ